MLLEARAAEAAARFPAAAAAAEEEAPRSPVCRSKLLSLSLLYLLLL